MAWLCSLPGDILIRPREGTSFTSLYNYLPLQGTGIFILPPQVSQLSFLSHSFALAIVLVSIPLFAHFGPVPPLPRIIMVGPSLILLTLACTLLCPQLFVLAQSQSLKDCIVKALNGKSSRAAFSNKFLFDILDVKRYNLAYDTDPIAVTYPESAQEVSGVVKCAAAANVFVQARSGGHSFGNYGESVPMMKCSQLTWPRSWGR